MLWLAFCALAGVTSAVSQKRQNTESFQLYAYGQDIGGWNMRYSNDGAYIIAADEDLSGFSSVNFTTTSKGLSTQGTLSISSGSSSNDTAVIGKLLAIAPNSNAAIIFEDTTSSSDVADHWMFFGAMLTYEGTKASFQAVPTTQDNILQIYWIADQENAPAGSVPVVIKQSAPAAPARPANAGGIGNAEMKRKLKKRVAMANH